MRAPLREGTADGKSASVARRGYSGLTGDVCDSYPDRVRAPPRSPERCRATNQGQRAITMSNTSASPSFGILYPGEMGAAVGELLRLQGFEVFTALSGRSPATRKRAEKAEIRDLGTVEQLFGRVHFLLSFVPPTAALGIAEAVAACPPRRTPPVFVDFNSTGPGVARGMSESLGKAGIDYVDGSIHGQACNLSSSATVYLSGSRRAEVGQVLSDFLRVRELGPDDRAASQCKMLLASLSKSLVALFLEAGLLARDADQLELFLQQARHFYPGLMRAIDRMAPTYPAHARRRVGEMVDVEETFSRFGLERGMATETRRFLEALAGANLPASPSNSEKWTTKALIEALAEAGVLRVREECDRDVS